MKKIISTFLATLIILSSLAISQTSAATNTSQPIVPVPFEPETPDNSDKVVLTLKNTTEGIKLSWLKVRYATSYSVYRKLKTDKKYSLIKKINNGTKISYVDKTAKAGKKYSYKLKTSTGATKTKTIIRLTTPKNVKASLKKDGDIALSWSKVKGAKIYDVYRAKVTSSGTGKYSYIFTTKSTKDVDWDMLAMGKSYKYKVVATNGKYKSAKSKASNSIKYMQPAVLALSISNDYKGVQMYYDYDKNVTKYEIYRKASGGSYSKIATITKPTIDKLTGYGTYKDTNCKTGVTYTYYIKSYVGKTSITSQKETIKYNDCDFKLTVGETKKLSLLSPEEETLLKDYEEWGITVDLSYTSLNEEVATVSDDSTVSALSPGIAEIKITITMKISVEGANTSSTSTTDIIKRIKVVE